MSKLQNCNVCGKVFLTLSSNTCPHCLDMEDELFEKVCRYLAANPGALIKEVSEETEVNEKKILEWLREGKLSNNENTVPFCIKCGESISQGILCPRCWEIHAKLKDIKEIRKSGSRMYTKNTD